MEIQDLSKKLVSGVLSLTFRRAILMAINFLTINILLARILPVAIIGVFDVASAILSFFTFFSDFGLGAAIIQRKEITQDDLKTTFVIQEILAIVITITVWFAAPIMAPLYQLDATGMWLIRILGFGFLLTSFKVIPAVLLERDLKFQPLVWVEVLETVVFNGMLVALVYSGMKIEAFSYATVFRSVAGLGLIYIIAPWRLRIGFSKKAARGLLSFGVPFQLNSLLALLKDRLVPLVIGKMVGPVGVGYITWSQGLAFLPLEVINIMIQVTFPAFSRIQHDRQTLKQTLEESLFFSTFFLYPMLFGLMAVFPSLVYHVVSSKWAPAFPLFYLFCLNTFWATLSTTFTNVLNAIGKIQITLKLMVMWTILTWVLSPALTYFYGFVGVAIASAVISFTSIIPIMIIKKELDVTVVKNIWKPLVASIVMAVPTYFVATFIVSNFLTLLVAIGVGGAFYMIAIYLLAATELKMYASRLKLVIGK